MRGALFLAQFRLVIPHISKGRHGAGSVSSAAPSRGQRSARKVYEMRIQSRNGSPFAFSTPFLHALRSGRPGATGPTPVTGTCEYTQGATLVIPHIVSAAVFSNKPEACQPLAGGYTRNECHHRTGRR